MDGFKILSQSGQTLFLHLDVPKVPTVSFFADPKGSGREIVLPMGQFNNLNALGADNSFSCLRFNTKKDRAPGIYDGGIMKQPLVSDPTTAFAAPFDPIALIVEVFIEWDRNGGIAAEPFIPGYGPHNLHLDRALVMVDSCSNLTADYGSEFNDSIIAVRVRKGPNYSGREVAKLHRDPKFKGGSVAFKWIARIS